jgi:hypothetical protein
VEHLCGDLLLHISGNKNGVTLHFRAFCRCAFIASNFDRRPPKNSLLSV